MYDETDTFDRGVFDNLVKHMVQQHDKAMFTAISSGTMVFFQDEFTDELWVPDAEAEFNEWEQDCKDYPAFDWGGISSSAAAAATKELLKRAEPMMMMERFGKIQKNNFVGSRTTGKTIKFRRYYSEEKQEEKTQVSCEDSDGTTYPVALRRIEV